MASAPSYEGTAPFVVDGETHHTYYKVFGDLAHRTRTPLIALHGGPGLVHNYLTPLAALATTASVPVILYDQLGNGRSTHLPAKPPGFWSIGLFVDELLSLAAHLGVAHDFALLGHSWGGALALELALRRRPPGLSRIVLTNSLPSLALWNASLAQLLQAFPADVQAGLAAGFGDLPRYRAALTVFYAVHGCTLSPPPQEYVDTLDAVFGASGDPTVSVAMFSGEFGTWSAVERLAELAVPVLVVNGRHDLSQDFVNAPFFERIQKVKWVTLEGASHMPMFEQPERYLALLADFLKLEF